MANHKLRELARTATGVVLEGTLDDCKTLAAHLGMEPAEYTGRILEFDGRKAIYAPHTANDYACCYFVGGGLMLKGRDDWTLVVPLARWQD